VLAEKLRDIGEITRLKEKLNAISEVIYNRPSPIRKYDQIHMRVGDFTQHIELIAGLMANRQAVFMGDGDSTALAVCYLSHLDLIPTPQHCTVLDFDERIVRSIRRFSHEFGFQDRIDAHLYNVVDPLPESLSRSHDFFYTNPPYGSANAGFSAIAFISRSLELCLRGSTGCVILPYDANLPWTKTVLLNVQRFLLESNLIIRGMISMLHLYHLDDNPNLRSGTIIAEVVEKKELMYQGKRIPFGKLKNFYGRSTTSMPRYIRPTMDGYKEDYEWGEVEARK